MMMREFLVAICITLLASIHVSAGIWMQHDSQHFVGTAGNTCKKDGIIIENDNLTLEKKESSISFSSRDDFANTEIQNIDINSSKFGVQLMKDYIFYDDFSGKIIDTNKWINKDTVGRITQNDKIIINGGNNDWWNTGMFSLKNFDRKPGLSLFFSVYVHSTTYIMLGWKDTSNNEHYRYYPYALYINQGNRIYIYQKGSGWNTGHTINLNRWYEFKITLKSSGATYYYRPSGSNQWTQVWNTNSYQDSPMKIGFIMHRGRCDVDNFIISEGDTAPYKKEGYILTKPIFTDYCINLTMNWSGYEDDTTNIEVRMRWGNNSVIDDSWSKWTRPLSSPTMTAGVFRYIQIRVLLSTSNKNSTPIFNDITIKMIKYKRMGYFISMIYDTGTVSPTITCVKYYADVPPGTDLKVKIRTSNNKNMENSSWEVVSNFQESFLSPPARYIQYSVEMKSDYTHRSPIFIKIEITYNSLPELTDDELSPERGNTSTEFEFRITYKDMDNTPPESINVVIDGRSIPMNKLLESDDDYIDGVVYHLVTTLGSGVHYYHFESSDGDAFVRYPEKRELKTPFINTPPYLTECMLSPQNGSIRYAYTYSVTYIDIDGNSPEYVKVVIDDEEHEMERLNGEPVRGISYKYTTKLKVGKHRYYFKTSDGFDDVKTEEFEGPIVINTLPICVISSPKNNSIYNDSDEITFDASECIDPDGGNIVEYMWESSVDGKIGDKVKFSKKLSHGTHKIKLIVIDSDGGRSSSEITITVLPPVKISVGSLMLDPPEPNDGDNVTIHAQIQNTGKRDMHDINVEIRIEDFSDSIKIDIRSGEMINLKFLWRATGGYKNISVLVNGKSIYEDSIVVNFLPVPVINATGDMTEGEKIKLDATSSYDVDGDIQSVMWEFGDGKTSSEEVCTHTYKSGKYTIILTVTDDKGAVNKTSFDITISKKEEVVSGGDNSAILGILTAISILNLLILFLVIMKLRSKERIRSEEKVHQPPLDRYPLPPQPPPSISPTHPPASTTHISAPQGYQYQHPPPPPQQPPQNIQQPIPPPQKEQLKSDERILSGLNMYDGNKSPK